MTEYLFAPDDGSRAYRAETMEFAAAVLDDEKVFGAMIGGALLEALREGKNILVISPANAQLSGSGGE